MTAASAADAMFIVSGEKALDLAEEIGEAIKLVKTPVLGDNDELCEECAGASICVDEWNMGEAAAKTASRILTGIADITKIQTGYATELVKVYNETLSSEQGIDKEILEGAGFEKISEED